jgi:hypothetical protein
MALRWPDIPMLLESDCQSVVTKIQTVGRDCSQIWQVLDEVREVGRQLNNL